MAKNDGKHFTAGEWVDFVNGQASPENMKAMQRHLNTSCENCKSIAGTWQRVREAAKRESDFMPPESAVRHIRSAFSVIAKPEAARKTFEIPRLVFDSLWQPVAVGVRSAVRAPRQVLYRAGKISVEMHVEPEPGSERLMITGQLSSAEGSDALLGIPVVITGLLGKVAEVKTNRFGEFHLAFPAQRGLRISFGIGSDREIAIPLDGANVMIFERN